MAALQNPYDETDAADLRAPRPDWARQVAGCSGAVQFDVITTG